MLDTSGSSIGRLKVSSKSFTSGVIMHKDSNNTLIDSMCIMDSNWPGGKHSPVYPDESTEKGLSEYVSGYVSTVPHIVYDRLR